MYTAFYNLTIKPFQISSDPAFIWLGEKHKEALATLTYGVLDNKGFMLLTGDVGTGKTTLINTLIEGLSDDILYASVPDPRLELNDFFNFIGQAFYLNKEFESKGKFLLHFRTFLEQAYADGKKVLLLIDESQLLTQELLEEIRLLSNIQKDGNNLLNIFFVGQDEFNEILDRRENRAVAQRLTLNYHLRPLTVQETDSYICHRLRIAGTTERLFDAEAVEEIHASSGGFPRRINIICDHCLLRGFVKEQKIIDGAMVRGCAHDLRIPQYLKRHEKAPEAEKSERPVAPERPLPPPRPIAPQPASTPEDFVKQRQAVYTQTAKKRSFFTGPVSALVMIVATVLLFLFVSPEEFLVTYHKVGDYLKGLSGVGLEQTQPPLKENVTPVGEAKDAPAKSAEDTASQEPQSQKSPVPDMMKKSAVYEDVNPSLLSTPPEDATNDVPVSEGDAPNVDRGGGHVPDQPGAKTESSELPPAAVIDPTVITSPSPGPAADVVGQEGLGAVQKDSAASKLAESSKLLPEETVMVSFEADSSDFYFTDIDDVNVFVDLIKNNPDAVVSISGHTDSLGEEGYNYKLSLFRANMIKSFFLGKGIMPNQLKVQGFGSSKPLASNDTPEGRRQNRRVEIDVLTK
jgi:general secretion pathway protein A